MRITYLRIPLSLCSGAQSVVLSDDSFSPEDFNLGRGLLSASWDRILQYPLLILSSVRFLASFCFVLLDPFCCCCCVAMGLITKRGGGMFCP